VPALRLSIEISLTPCSDDLGLLSGFRSAWPIPLRLTLFIAFLIRDANQKCETTWFGISTLMTPG
jgi:hypothetical protein